jgi:arylsulfatase A-like enzyme
MDRYLQWFLERLFDRVGRGNIVLVLTADHAVTPYPEVARRQGHPEAQWVDIDSVIRDANTRFARLGGVDGDTRWLEFDTGLLFLRDNGRLAAIGANTDSALASLASRIRAVAGVARVDRPADLARADTVADAIARRWSHHLPADARVVLTVTLKEFNSWGSPGIAQHGQPSEADAHVPLILWGRGILRGSYAARANTVDVAPTLARLLGLTPFSLLDGRVLKEAVDAAR